MFSWLFKDFDITRNISESIGNPGKRHIYNYRLGDHKTFAPKERLYLHVHVKDAISTY